MGQEIVYCFKCSNRMIGAEFDKGSAIQIGNRACCAQCLPAVLAELPEAQRQTLLAELSRTSREQPSKAMKKTPRGGTEIPSMTTPGHGSAIPEAAPKSFSPVLIGAIIAGLGVVLLLLFLALGGGDKPQPPATRQEVGPADPPLPRDV